jgi:hypothetical protein
MTLTKSVGMLLAWEHQLDNQNDKLKNTQDIRKYLNYTNKLMLVTCAHRLSQYGYRFFQSDNILTIFWKQNDCYRCANQTILKIEDLN